MFFAEDRDSAGTSSKADRRRLNKNERLVVFLSLSLKVRTFHLNWGICFCYYSKYNLLLNYHTFQGWWFLVRTVAGGVRNWEWCPLLRPKYLDGSRRTWRNAKTLPKALALTSWNSKLENLRNWKNTNTQINNLNSHVSCQFDLFYQRYTSSLWFLLIYSFINFLIFWNFWQGPGDSFKQILQFSSVLGIAIYFYCICVF